MKKLSSSINKHKLKINLDSFLKESERDNKEQEYENKLFSISYPKIFSAVIIDQESPNMLKMEENIKKNLPKNFVIKNSKKKNNLYSIPNIDKSPLLKLNKNNDIINITTLEKKLKVDTKNELKINNLDNLKQLFIDFFQGNDRIYLKNYKLDIWDYKIIFIILKRKFPYLKNMLEKSSKEIINENISDNKKKEELCYIFSKIYSFPSKKRVEENNKFVYKLTLKKLRNKFYKKRNLKNNKRTELLFYRYYFQNDAKLKSRNLKDFYDPLNIKETKKTLNNTFLKLIFQTEKFKKNFLDILNTKFKRSYMKTIPNKINKLFQKLEIDCEKLGKNIAVMNYVKFVKKVKRFKLPWFVAEVDMSIVAFNQLIHKF